MTIDIDKADAVNDSGDPVDPVRRRAHEILGEHDHNQATGCEFPVCMAADLAIRLARLELKTGERSEP